MSRATIRQIERPWVGLHNHNDNFDSTFRKIIIMMKSIIKLSSLMNLYVAYMSSFSELREVIHTKIVFI